ncbi:MAG: protein translocase subunit SecD [Gammaproteobacteria bacterium]|nr:MAG: protein translocase subunit SecD [Gammaproteobacteria bacterium]
MLNQYPLWKNLLVVCVVAIGLLYSIPNFYPEQPIIQVSGASASVVVGEKIINQSKRALDDAGIAYGESEFEEHSGLIRFASDEAQREALGAIRAALDGDYVVALNRAPTTPGWLDSLGGSPMNLGLDLRGGVHFLLEVDMDKALEPREEAYVSEIKTSFREEKIYYRSVNRGNGQIRVKFKDQEQRDKGLAWLKERYREFLIESEDVAGVLFVNLSFTAQKIKEIQDYAISQNLTALRNRVNELGVAEPLVQRQGVDRIVVELPGVQDTAKAKRIIGRTASLEFRLEDSEHDLQRAINGIVPPQSELFEFKGYGGGRPVLTIKKVIVTGEHVVGAKQGFDENGRAEVNITLDGKGGKLMNLSTKTNVGRRMAVIFVEHKEDVEYKGGVETKRRYVEKYAINVATIQSALGYNFRITGLDNTIEARELALLLRAGALAAPMYFVEERTVGPTLGADNIAAGMQSIAWGFAAVLLFMLFYYRVFGIVANIALVMNIVILVAVMSLIPGATLTLPGIAGIVLTVGMAVDANVLIFARIKEELANGLSPQAAISAGYDRAFVTIMDANITTLLVALVLFAGGTGPVKGFAVTLSIGILTSMFTAIVGTRALVNLIYGGRSVSRLSI